MVVSAHAQQKMAKMVQNASELAKIPVLYEIEHGELNFGVNF